MDQAQARALLAGEQARLQRLLQVASGEQQAAELGGWSTLGWPSSIEGAVALDV